MICKHDLKAGSLSQSQDEALRPRRGPQIPGHGLGVVARERAGIRGGVVPDRFHSSFIFLLSFCYRQPPGLRGPEGHVGGPGALEKESPLTAPILSRP